MDIDKIIQLIDKVSESSISNINIEEGSLKISIEKKQGVVTAFTEPVLAAPQTVQIAQAPQAFAAAVPSETALKAQTPGVKDPAEEDDEDTRFITSPIVGVFYAAPSPDSKPYVQVGDTVKKGQVVGIVEAMKLMNEIESEEDGVITQILVENQSAVEYGQPLFKIK